MLLSLSWLREYIPRLPKPAALAERLALHGLEVEEIIDRRGAYDHVVVGEILAIRPHPNADKLRLADVRVQAGGPAQEIVCGAPNIAIGQKVPVALLGATLPNGLTIESRPIRGVVSNGMLCAADELGLGNDHRGIMILEATATVGTPLATVLGLDDVVLDIATPANRADFLSVRGLAREIAAILGEKAVFPKIPTIRRQTGITTRVQVSAPKLCPVYTAQTIDQLVIGPSPAWLQQRLQSAGLRPINAVVDVTNLILLEYGQPLHAFDADTLRGPLVVRLARAGERLVTLDRQERALMPEDIVIADDRGPVALAGVMGGAETEVTEKTTRVVLESAVFHPVNIRRTTRRLGLQSEASKRFERGLWPTLPLEASAAATALLVDLAHGRAVGQPVRVGRGVAPSVAISFPLAMIAERLGFSIPVARAKKILLQLGYVVTGTARQWRVRPPAWRLDVHGPEDVLDDIGRIYGYETLPTVWPTTVTLPVALPDSLAAKTRIRNALVGTGAIEVITHSYYSEAVARVVGGEHIRVANPLDSTQQCLRRSFLPALEHILEAEADAGRSVTLFEVGRVYEPGAPVRQPWRVALGLTVKPGAGYVPGWNMLGVVRHLFQIMTGQDGIPDAVTITSREYKRRTIECAELDLRLLIGQHRHFFDQTQSTFPAVERDISGWFSPATVFGEIMKLIQDPHQPLLQSVSLVDMFEQDGRRSYTFRLVFQALDRTLTTSDIEPLEAAIRTRLQASGATLR